MTRISENYVKLLCADCKKINYRTRKNKKQHKEKITLQKFCPSCRKHTDHKEIK